MNLLEIIEYLNKLSEEGKDLENAQIKDIVKELKTVTKVQNEILHEIKNANIRVENKIKYIEIEVEKNKVYKSIVDTMLERIKQNPITALMYFYSIRKNIEKIINE